MAGEDDKLIASNGAIDPGFEWCMVFKDPTDEAYTWYTDFKTHLEAHELEWLEIHKPAERYKKDKEDRRLLFVRLSARKHDALVQRRSWVQKSIHKIELTDEYEAQENVLTPAEHAFEVDGLLRDVFKQVLKPKTPKEMEKEIDYFEAVRFLLCNLFFF
jgi:hypothetical protein